MSRIEPGDRFTVKYGNGHTVDVIGMNGRQKSKVLSIIDRVQSLDESKDGRAVLFELAEEALRLCVPNCTEEFIESLNESMQLEIVGAAIGEQALSEDDKKKLELPLLSDAENSVGDAAAVA